MVSIKQNVKRKNAIGDSYIKHRASAENLLLTSYFIVVFSCVCVCFFHCCFFVCVCVCVWGEGEGEGGMQERHDVRFFLTTYQQTIHT